MTDLVDLGRRTTQVLRRDGLGVVTGKLFSRMADRLLEGAQPFQIDVRPEDVLAGVPVREPRPAPPRDGALTLNWVINPPTEVSGGMGTAMTCVRLLEQRGHECRLYVMYKGTRRNLDRDREAARQRFPLVRATIEDVSRGMRPADALVATAWPTAYITRASALDAARLYLVQDFEPAFYPASSNAVLAEETYRFGFHGVTAGPWLAEKLHAAYDMTTDYFDLGVDLDCYRFDPSVARSGVVFFARPGTPRRGFQLGMMALELFARAHPEIDIHLVGQEVRWRKPTFRFVNHGHLTPSELAALYGRCSAGLVLSLSNLSLLPAELSACGCIPVMNDAENTRAGFANPHARFAAPTPQGLAAELGEAVVAMSAEDRAQAAASVGELGWDVVADQLERAIRVGLERSTRTGP